MAKKRNRVITEEQQGLEYWHQKEMPIFPPLPEEMGLPENWSQEPAKYAVDFSIESICGPADESQEVEQYDGTLGVTVAFVNARQGPVGQLQWNNNLAALYTNPGNVSGVRWGSGTLISRDLYLTAGHCFDQTGGGWNRPLINGTTNVISPAQIATNMHVNFNFQEDPAGVLRTEVSFPVIALVEYRLNGLDYAIARLGGNPGTTYGWTQISATDAAVGNMLCIIGHPAGLPKRIEAGTCTDLHGDLIGYNDIDTLGGNSGSGILSSPAGRIVGVHTNGGCNAAMTGHNHGVRISSIINASATVQGLLLPKLKIADDGGFKKILDDPIKLKFRDDPPTGIKKVLDDPIKRKFTDDPIPKRKSFDDVKLPALDVNPGDPWAPVINPGIGGQAPFVIATPHHSMAWAGQQQTAAFEGEDLLVRYEAQLNQLQQVMQQASAELTSLQQSYAQMVNEYQALAAEVQRKQSGGT